MPFANMGSQVAGILAAGQPWQCAFTQMKPGRSSLVKFLRCGNRAAKVIIGEWRAHPGPLGMDHRVWSRRNAHVLTLWSKAPQTRAGELPWLYEVPGKPQPEPALPPDVTVCLGERLQAHDAYLMNEPVPDDLLRILEALGRSGRAGSGR
jgi:hypothetical protein